MTPRFVFEAPGALTGPWRQAALTAIAGSSRAAVTEQPLTEPLLHALGPLLADGGHAPGSPSPAAGNSQVLLSQLPLALQPPPAQWPSVAMLAPPAQLMHFALQHPRMPSWRALLDAGLCSETYRLLCSPGFDLLRLRADDEAGLPCLATNHGDACTVDEALSELGRFGLVLLGQGEQALETMQLLMHFQQLPPTADSLGATTHASPDAWPADAQALVSDFDRRFFAAAHAKYALAPDQTRSRYEAYRADYPAVHGLDLAPRTGQAWPLDGWIGPGWHPAEWAEGTDRCFRWSAGSGSAVHVPLRHPGRYRIRAYLHPQGTPDIQARVGELPAPAGDMFALDHDDMRVLDGEFTLRQAAWCGMAFEHGELPRRDGPDERQRGFVLGKVLVRRLS
jgi:hypothetical protein